MKCTRTRVLTGLLLFLLTCPGLWAQSTAQISGAIKDQTGAVLPGVEITVAQTATGLTRTALTDETGSYTITSLPVGPYRLEAALPGFKTYAQTGIVLQVNASPVINAVLEVGQVSDQIEVQADAALVETRRTGIAQMLDNQRVLELPLNGRQVTELILLSGVATVSNNGGLNPGTRNYPTVVISVAGGLENALTYMLDGGMHNDPYNNLNLPMPFPDALQEFKVETSGLSAQYGFHSSGAVNAVTKSGTNQFHGSLFEFVRNGSMNARNAFALDNDGLKRNQFGGTIGGPIVRNKLFFFGAHQTTTERSRPTTNRAFIPTAQMLAGDWTTVTSPACNGGRQVPLRAPFVNNRVDPSLFSPPAVNLTKHALFPTTTDPCGEVRFGRVNILDEHITVGKVDYQLSDKHSMFARYMQARRDTPTDFDGKNILTLSIGTSKQRVYSLVLGSTYLIGANMVSSFRGTVNRTAIPKFPPKAFTLTDLGVKGLYEDVPDYATVRVTNGFTVTGSNPNPGHYNTVSFQLSEDLSFVRGAHQIGFGGSFAHANLNVSSGILRALDPNFDGQFTGTGLSDFMLGRLSRIRQGNAVVSHTRLNSMGYYLQDTWKATQRLTVNAGLRWEPYFGAYAAHGHVGHFDKAAFDKGVRSTVYKNAPPGLLFPGDPGIPGNKYTKDHLLHFAPRVGLAWDPGGDGRMTIRTAYGLLFDTPQLYEYQATGESAPFGNSVLIDAPLGTFEEPWRGYPGGNPFPLYPNPDIQFALGSPYGNFKHDLKVPYVHQWNLSLQKQLGEDWLVAGNYIGNSTIHISGISEGNPVIYIPGASTTANANQRRVLYLQDPQKGAYYSAIGQIDDAGTSNYHGMLLSVQRRARAGVTIQGNYTWSHCIGDDLVPGSGIVTSATYPGRRGFDRGNCGGDRRHSVNLSTVATTPQFANSTLRVLGSGWQVSGIVRLLSGSSFTVISGFDTALTGAVGSNRANQVMTDPYAENKGIDRWLNAAAFARPANGEWGNAANDLRGPGRITINMGLTRKFQIRESQLIEFRAEAFNLPNHVNPNNPTTALNNPNFGRILSADDPRIMQLALKYVF